MNLIKFTASARAQAAIAKACEKEPLPLGFVNATDSSPAELLMYGEIGNSYEQGDARSVGQFLRANKGKPVNVRINSGGGLAFDGITIHNALVAHDGKVTTTIEGVAASAASIIAMAGRPTRMYDNATLMMHRAQGGGYGNQGVMLELADILGKIDEGLARTYQAKSGMPMREIMSMMDGKVDGTWLTAKEARSKGFVDEIMRPSTEKALSPAVIAAAKRQDRRQFLSK